MKRSAFFCLLLVLSFFGKMGNLAAQCNPGEIPGTDIQCKSAVTVQTYLGAPFADISANDILDGQHCWNDWTFLISDANNPNSTNQLSNLFLIGTHQIRVRSRAEFTGIYEDSCICTVTVVPNTACMNDVTPPVVNLNSGLSKLYLAPTGTAVLTAQAVGGSSFDACSGPIDLRIEQGNGSATPPATTEVSFTTVGSFPVTVWAGDTSGNWAKKTKFMQVLACQPLTLTTALACDDKTDVMLDASGNATIESDDIIENYPPGSFCPTSIELKSQIWEKPGTSFPNLPYPATAQPSFSVNTSHIGLHTMRVQTFDNATAGNSCWGEVRILPFFDCAGDVTPPITICKTGLQISKLTPNAVVLQASEVNNGSSDNCTPAVGLNFFIANGATPNAPPPAAQQIQITSLGTKTVTLWTVDSEGNYSACVTTVEVLDCIPNGAVQCSNFVQVSLGQNNTSTFGPEALLQGGYCPGNYTYLIDLAPFEGIYEPFFTVDSTDFLDTIPFRVASFFGTDTMPTAECEGNIYVSKAVWFCGNDIEPPFITLPSSAPTVTIGSSGSAILTPAEVIDSTWDYCSSVDLKIRKVIANSPPGASSLTVTAADGPVLLVQITATDASGNIKLEYNEVLVQLQPSGCLGDVLKPIVIAPANMTVTPAVFSTINLNDDAAVNAAFGLPTASDNCGIAQINETRTLNPIGNCGAQIYQRVFVAVDSAGLLSAPATQKITVLKPLLDYQINFPKDRLPSDLSTEMLTVNDPAGNTNFNFVDQNFDYDCAPGSGFIIRKWTVTNFCDLQIPQVVTDLPRLDLNGDGSVGDGFSLQTSGANLVPTPGNPLVPTVPRGTILTYIQHIRTNWADTIQHVVSGKVFLDENANCLLDAPEPGMIQWEVVAIGQPSGETRTTLSDAAGLFSIETCPFDTAVTLSLGLPYNYGGATCPTTYFLQFSSPIGDENLTQNIGAQLDDSCPTIVLDMESPKIRPCFPGHYSVAFANVSEELIEDVFVEVLLDDDLQFTTSPQPHTLLSPQLYRFEIGDLAPGQAGTFPINFFPDCDATPGATHCSEAHIYPDTICPNSIFWSLANIEVEGICANDSVFFKIKNTGAGPSSMLDFVVVEDVVMKMAGDFQLASGDSLLLAPIAADGSTYRLEVEQEPGHPYGGLPAIAIEGCAGFTQGMVMQFPLGNANPFIAFVCQENVNSFDPNIKEASPRGMGPEHLIEPTTELEYTIHFQNTGTDTAFRVVILDTLSPFLDASKIVAGAASHPFRFERLPGSVLRFTFDGINLPDSSANFEASQGFVRLLIPQKPGNIDGSRIENRAAIYFDFNDPIFTPVIFHTVERDFLEVVSVKNFGDAPELEIYPNPAAEAVYFAVNQSVMSKNLTSEGLRFSLFNLQGQPVFRENFNAFPFRFDRKNLPEGAYFFKIESAHGDAFWSGKVILK